MLNESINNRTWRIQWKYQLNDMKIHHATYWHCYRHIGWYDYDYLVYSINFISRGSRIGQQLWQSPRGAGEYMTGEPPINQIIKSQISLFSIYSGGLNSIGFNLWLWIKTMAYNNTNFLFRFNLFRSAFALSNGNRKTKIITIQIGYFNTNWALLIKRAQ